MYPGSKCYRVVLMDNFQVVGEFRSDRTLPVAVPVATEGP